MANTSKTTPQQWMGFLAVLGLAARLMTCIFDQRGTPPAARIPVVQPRDEAAEYKSTLRVATVRVEPDPLVFDGRDRRIRGTALVTFNEPAAEPGSVEVAAVLPRNATRFAFPTILGRQKFATGQSQVQVKLDGSAENVGEIEVRTLIEGQPTAFTHWMKGRLLDSSQAASVLLPPGRGGRDARSGARVVGLDAGRSAVAECISSRTEGGTRAVAGSSRRRASPAGNRGGPDGSRLRGPPAGLRLAEAEVSVTFYTAATRAGTAVVYGGEPGGRPGNPIGRQAFSPGQASVRVKVKFRAPPAGILALQVRITGQAEQASFGTTVTLRKK